MAGLLPSRPLLAKRLRSEPRFALAGSQRRTAHAYERQITVGAPGRCPAKPVLYIGIYDNSGSILGGNDPIGQRFVEGYVAISRVGARCRCGKDLAATLHFDTPTSGDLAPTPITRQHHDELRASLAVPADGAGISALGPSISAARRLIDRFPSHHAIVVVHSDFLLFDNYLNEFINFPGDAVAVVLRAKPPQALVDAPTVKVIEVDHTSAPGIIARSVFTALTATRPGAKPRQIA